MNGCRGGNFCQFGNVARDGFGRDKIHIAKLRQRFEAIKMAGDAVALQSSNGAWMPGGGVEVGDDVDRKSMLVVVGRDMSLLM